MGSGMTVSVTAKSPLRHRGLEDLGPSFKSRIGKSVRMADPRIREAIVFGSYARAEAMAGSDIDIAVIYSGNRSDWLDVATNARCALSWIESEMHMEFDLVSVQEDEFKKGLQPLVREIQRDGIYV